MSDNQCWVGLDDHNVIQSISISNRGDSDAKTFVSDGGLRPYFIDADLAISHFKSREPIFAVDIDLDAAIRPGIEGLQVIAHVLHNAGTFGSDMLASRIVAALAHHDPPILLCFPDQIKDS